MLPLLEAAPSGEGDVLSSIYLNRCPGGAAMFHRCANDVLALWVRSERRVGCCSRRRLPSSGHEPDEQFAPTSFARMLEGKAARVRTADSRISPRLRNNASKAYSGLARRARDDSSALVQTCRGAVVHRRSIRPTMLNFRPTSAGDFQWPCRGAAWPPSAPARDAHSRDRTGARAGRRAGSGSAPNPRKPGALRG